MADLGQDDWIVDNDFTESSSVLPAFGKRFRFRLIAICNLPTRSH